MIGLKKWMNYRRSSPGRYKRAIISHAIGAAGVGLLLAAYSPYLLKNAVLIGSVLIIIMALEHVATFAAFGKRRKRR